MLQQSFVANLSTDRLTLWKLSNDIVLAIEDDCCNKDSKN